MISSRTSWATVISPSLIHIVYDVNMRHNYMGPKRLGKIYDVFYRHLIIETVENRYGREG